MAETPFEREAAAVRRFAREVGALARSGERTLAERAGAELRAFEARLAASQANPRSITPARYALAVLIDHAVRAEPRVRLSAWLAAAHVHLFDRRDLTIDTIRRFRDTAQAEGPDYAQLAAFLDGVVGEIEGARRTRGSVSRLPALYLAFGILCLLVSLGAYAAFLDYRYHARLTRAFEDQIAGVQGESDADRLDRLADLSAQVGRASAAAPLAQLVRIPLWASGPRVARIYRDAVAGVLPGAIRGAIGEALATEGEDIEQYDALRAWSVLSGRSDWSPAFLAGWLEAHDVRLGTGRLARHVAVLAGPRPDLAPPDDELLAQAAGFAALASEEDRAFLELSRLDEVRALPAWDPEAAVPGLGEVVVRRSGRPLGEGAPRLFTEVGWTYARDIGVGVAVRRTRLEAGRLLAKAPDSRNDTPDRVMEVLQSATLDYWKRWLADLRVRPFSDQDSAVRISGALAQAHSPLELLLLEVWRQVGGRDRLRPHPIQLEIASAFGPSIQYVEQGKVRELSGLFAALNAALGAIEFDEERGAEQLMNVQQLARSVSALRAAPPIVAQIAEDVLAQTSAAHSSLLTNPLTREWQQRVLPLCRQVVEGHYPFGEGSDADVAHFAQLFGPSGALPRFVNGYAAQYLDTDSETWRWKPEARLSGVEQESARFLQETMALSAGFFSSDGVLGRPFEIAALAERGEATLVVGGAGLAVRAADASQTLAWPGPDPVLGAEVSFRLGADSARIAEAGPWGLLRLLDRTRIRQREEGRRFLVDLRTDTGRLFFELGFDAPANPVSVRRLAKGMTCPPVL